MELTYEDLDDGVRRIRLAGRMDVEGSREIDLKFTSLTASRQAFVIVDLSLVDFLSSLGLGTLVRSAKAQMSRAGRMVLLSPQAHVGRHSCPSPTRREASCHSEQRWLTGKRGRSALRRL